jgi:two-component system, OmpR family, phosphate regulon response regulator PhoB
MNRVTILTTNPMLEFENFELNDAVFEFRSLKAGGPSALIEGAGWIFVDWVLDDLAGLEMCRRLRTDSRTRDCHITLVLEQDDIEDRRRAIRAGADDYMVGPADKQAILDRVLALTPGRAQPRWNDVVEVGGLRIDVGAEQARWRGKPVLLRPNEFRLLRYLAENPNRVLSRRELIDGLGKAGDPDYLRTVDVWIKRLRFSLRQAGAGQLLRTVHNKGYVLDVA